jgi:hypothetical protein
MKRILLLPAVLVTFTALAQTPLNVSTPIVQKATATWCGPCGQWGWTLMDEIRQDNKAKAFVFSLYGDNASNYYNPAAGDLTSWGQSWPNWGVNNINRTAFSASGGIYSTTTRTTIKAAVDSFAATTPVASTGFTYTISGSTLTVTTNTKFWKAPGSSEYFLEAYVVEDSVYGTQNGQTGSVYHHDVLRKGMTAASSYGVSLGSGIAINTVKPKTFTTTLDATWNKNRIKVLTIIWKKNGSNYDFVNANGKKSVGTSVASIEAVEELDVYPNPASATINVSGTLNVTGAVQIRMVNAVGQVVYSKELTTQSNNLSEAINVQNLSAGVYMLEIASNEARSSRRVVVSK